MRSVDAVLQELFSFHRFGIKPGLENITALLDTLGNPHRKLRTVHVAGTNGKGTSCSVIASVLTEAGYNVGLYTSPHILRFNERIRVNGVEIDDSDIARLAEIIMPATRKLQGTFFEATTAMAFAYFADCGVDIAVIETGMGGRLDSTNVLTPLLSVITSIDLEHTHYLGTTLSAIAVEKAGIIKRNVPVLVGEPRAELRPVFADKASAEHAPIVFIDDVCTISDQTYSPDLSMSLSLAAPDVVHSGLRVPLPGVHTARNVAIGVYALHMLRTNFPHTEEHVRRGVEQIRRNAGLRGRIELLQPEPMLVLDVAHNQAGIRALADALQRCGLGGNRWAVVVGAMEDKAISDMLEELLPLTRVLFATSPAVERALPAEELGNRARSAGFSGVHVCPVVAHAVDAALQTGSPVLVVGSFYLADEALSHWEKSQKREAGTEEKFA